MAPRLHVFALFILAVLTRSGYAIECFGCNTLTDRHCGDPFHHTSQETHDCDQQLTQFPRPPNVDLFDQMRGADQINTNTKAVCFKAIFEGDSMSGASAHGSSGLPNRIGLTTEQPFESSPTPFPTTDETPQECGGGSWRYPPNCNSQRNECEYEAIWKLLGGGTDVHFTVINKNSNLWTGIGFSKDGRMANSDAIIGWVHQGIQYVADVWNTGYAPPQKDRQQSIKDVSGKVVNGVTTFTFVRPLDTRDQQDTPLSGEHCPFFVFPVKGGTFNSVNKDIHKHEQIEVSEQPICVTPCAPRRAKRQVQSSGDVIARGCGYKGYKEQCKHIKEISRQRGLKLKDCKVCEGTKCNSAPTSLAVSTFCLIFFFITSRLVQ